MRCQCQGSIPQSLVEFVEYERNQLPSKLLKNYKRYTQFSAEVESNGVKANRLQNLFITLDKAKYFLRKQDDAVHHAATSYPECSLDN